MDGEIVIGTRLDLDEFEKDLKKLNRSEVIDKKIKLTTDKSNIDATIKGLKKQIENLEESAKNVKLGKITREDAEIGLFSGTLESNIEERKQRLAELLPQQKEVTAQYEKVKEYLDKIDGVEKDVTKEIEKQADAQKDVTKEVKKTNDESKKGKFKEGLKDSTKKAGELGKSFGKVGAIIGGLAIAGIVGLIGLASEKSETISASLERIGLIISHLLEELASLLLPILEKIVKFIEKVLYYIGAILYSWFGIDILSSKASDNLSKTTKSAKELRKQLMGFDEMNILNKDTGSTGIGAGGGSTTADLGFKVDTESLKKAYNKVKNWFLDLPIPINLDYVGDALKNPKLYITTFWNEIKRLLGEGNSIPGAIAGAIFGEDSIARIGANIVHFIQHPISSIASWGASLGKKLYNWIFGGDEEEVEADYTNIMNNLDGLSDNMKKLLHLPDDFTTKNLVDEFMDATTEINGDMVTVKTKSGKIMKLTKKQYMDLMESVISYSQNGSKKQQKDMDDVENKSTTTTDNIKNNWFTTFNDIIKKYPEVAQAILDGNYEIKKDYVEVKTKSGEVVKYSIDEFEKLKNKLTNVGDEGVNSADKTKTGWFTKMNDIIAKATGKDNNGLEGAVTGAFNSIENNSKTTGENTKKNWLEKINDLIVGAKQKVDNYNKDPSTLKVEVEQDKKENSGSVIKDVENDIKNKNKNPFVLKLLSKLDTSEMMSTIRKLAKSWPAVWKPILSKLESYGLAKGGVISYPRLASGGIINRPGRGVPLAVGGAIGGERGREAVLPLTDSQQMSYLGREIAKNIIINLTNVTELDGRQIAITTAKVMNDMQFQSNGGVM